MTPPASSRRRSSEVVKTLFEALALVVLVVFVFLQNWRMTLIPAIAIPVSLIGTFAVFDLLGFSINQITLFGLVLAIGIVVDDAIVVVENVQRKLSEGLAPRDATVAAMREVTGPVVATSLVLAAVFVPVGFIPGHHRPSLPAVRRYHRRRRPDLDGQRADVEPGACAHRSSAPTPPPPGRFFRLFDRGFAATLGAYGRIVGILVRRVALVMFVFVLMLAATWGGFVTLPRAFLPEEDQGYFFVNVQLPPAAALNRTVDVMDQVTRILQETPGVRNVVAIGGYSFLTGTTAPNAGVVFAVLDPWAERTAPELRSTAIIGTLRGRLFAIPEAMVIAFNPPSIRGLGTTGGFDFQLQDLGGGTPQDLAAVLGALIVRANQVAGTAQRLLDVPGRYAAGLGRGRSRQGEAAGRVPDRDLHHFADSARFLLRQRLQQVRPRISGGAAGRDDLSAEAGRHSRSLRPQQPGRDGAAPDAGDAVVDPRPRHHPPLSTCSAPPRSTASRPPGRSSGDAMQAMQRLAAEVLPADMTFAWSGISLQEITAGQKTPVILGLAVLFAYLFLVAQYNSWSLPFAVILSVPVAALGAIAGLMLIGIANNIFAQIGMVLLIGLAAKNAILIVEFAKVKREQGLPILDAAKTAARLRFRAIMMTAFSFILGVVPLLLASGAGAASRRSIGTTVFSGMLAATVVGTLLVPVFWVAIQRLVERASKVGPEPRAAASEPASKPAE